MTQLLANVTLFNWSEQGEPVAVAPETHFLERSERYEPPLPLYRLTEGELQRLRDSMKGLLTSYACVFPDARLDAAPGWLSPLKTEYSFVCDALHEAQKEGHDDSR